MKRPELMAPAGDWTMLHSVIRAGANAVYFGVDNLNMRVKAKNFTLSDLKEIVELCKLNNVTTYLTINIIIYENELESIDSLIKTAKEAGVDNIICWDFAVIQLCKKHNIPFCISTQASVSNTMSVKFFEDLGAKRVVLARECTLDQIKEIKQNSNIEIETFIHGAMCIAVSGRCFMSHHLFGKSANRGECIQPCRREYEVVDNSIHKSMTLGDDYVLSPNDLCTIEILDELLEAGIDSFKIEGRKRSPEYAAKSVEIYSKAIDDYLDGNLTEENKKIYLKELAQVYNRGSSKGFYSGIPSSEAYAGIYGSKAESKKTYVGKILNYYKEAKAAYLTMEAGSFNTDDELIIMGPTTGVIYIKPDNIIKEDVTVNEAVKGDKITIPCEELIRPKDQVYKIEKTGR